MKSLIKWLVIAVLAVILLPIMLGVIASLVINPNDFKPEIIEAVEKQTRGSLAIDGELNWSFFPSVGVDLNQVTFELPEDKGKPFASLDAVKLSIKLLPLLRMAVEADGLTVSGLALELHTDKNGVNNWDQIFPETKEAQEEPEADSGVAAGPLAVDIAKIAIEDSSVHMTNAQEGSEYLLNNFNFESTDISADGDEFPLDISFDVSLSDPNVTSQSKIKTKLSADMAKQLFQFNDLNADFLLAGETFADKKVNINVVSSGEYNGAANTADLKELRIEVADALKTAMQVRVSNLDAKPKIAGEITVDSFDANDLLQALGMEAMVFNNEKALSDISFAGKLSGPANSFVMDPVTVQLDSTKMTGRMGIINLDSSEYVFSLHGDSINIDDYSTPVTDEEQPANATDVNAALLPLAALRDLLFNAEFGFDNIIAGGLTITDLDMKANGDKGLIKLKKLGAKLYQGEMDMNATIDARRKVPTMALNTKLSGVDMKSLMTDFAELETISGTARFNAQFKTSGNTTASFQSNLNGPLSFGIDNAVLNNLNVDKLACTAISKARGKTMKKDNWPATTTFKKIGGVFQFTNGVGTNDDLAASLENMQITGNGVIDLPANNIDYRVALKISGDITEPGVDENGVAAEDSACAINKKYRNIAWPIRCKGPLDAEPGDMCGIDAEGIAKAATNMLADKAKSKLAEKLFGKKNESGSEEDGSDDGEEESSSDKLKSFLKKL